MLLPDLFCVCQALFEIRLRRHNADISFFQFFFMLYFFFWFLPTSALWKLEGCRRSAFNSTRSSKFDDFSSISSGEQQKIPWRLQLSPNQLGQAWELIGVYKWKENSKKSERNKGTEALASNKTLEPSSLAPRLGIPRSLHRAERIKGFCRWRWGDEDFDDVCIDSLQMISHSFFLFSLCT